MPVITAESRRCTAALVLAALPLLFPSAVADAKADKAAYERNQKLLEAEMRKQEVDNPLLLPEMLPAYQAVRKEWTNLLTNGTDGRNPNDLKTLRTALDLRLFTLSTPLPAKDLGIALTTVRREFKRAGAGIENASRKSQFRRLLFDESIPRLKKMLTGSFMSRSMAIELLADLEVVQRNPINPRIRLEFHPEVDDLFVEILKDPKQSDSVKTRVTNSVSNFLQKTDIKPTVQLPIAIELVREVGKEHSSVGYQDSLLWALEEFSVARELGDNERALIMDAAATILADPDRDIIVRCHAAGVMGRAGFDNRTRFDATAWMSARLTEELFVAFAQAKPADRANRKWQNCAAHVLRCYRHWGKDERSTNEPGLPKGLMNRAPKNQAVNDAFVVVEPLLTEIFSGQPGRDAAASLQALGDWIEKNQPPVMTYDTNSPPFNVN